MTTTNAADYVNAKMPEDAALDRAYDYITRRLAAEAPELFAKYLRAMAAAHPEILAAPVHTHDYLAAGFDARSEWDRLNRQNLLICNICDAELGATF
jgi:hypothetical protein